MNQHPPTSTPWRTGLTAALFCWVGATSSALASGGDGFSENAFAPESAVSAQDLPAYGQGHLGVVPYSYWRVYLFLAYRAASGQALNKAELDALQLNGWKVGSVSNREDQDPGLARDAWLAARTAVAGAAPLQLEVEKYDEVHYASYVNCPADALRRAASTLEARLKTGGPQWSRVWLANQDAVFANCGLRTDVRGGQPKPVSPMPAPLPGTAPAWLKQDHAYQTAAALFYAGQFDAARARFQAIGKDAASPWQKWGDYLAARCLIRQATLARGRAGEVNSEQAKAEAQQWRGLLETARSELVQASKAFIPARQLLGWVDARVRPQQRLGELARVLGNGRFTPESPGLLSDYLLILDANEADMLKASEPMTRWIGAMQGAGSPLLRKQALALARAQWLSSKRDALWLVPMLQQARDGELHADELKAAAAVPATSPVYVHLQYQLARLALVQGQAEEADTRVSALLSKSPPMALSTPTRNRLLGLKMLSGATREAFFQAAARTPAQTEAGVPITDEATSKPAPAAAAASMPQATDGDYPRHLYRQFSLAELQSARPFTKNLAPDGFAGTVWTRAVILGNFAVADAYTDELMVGRATTQHLFRRYQAASGLQAKRDAAMLILVNVPELAPHLIRASSGYSNGAWDCGPAMPATASPGDQDPPALPDELDAVWPRFLSAEARAEVGREMKTLLALPKRSDYLAPWLLDWAQRQPKDPEVPKALHFFVASTRMECPVYGQQPAVRRKSHSQQAFELLHKRYPQSEWAAKTKYHF